MATARARVPPLHSHGRVFVSTVENFELLTGEDLEAPYKNLLDHTDLLTPRLVDYFADQIALEVLEKKTQGNLLWRSVHLRLAGSRQIVVYAEIQVDLQLVPEHLVDQVLADVRPLGELLREAGLDCVSTPTLFRLGVLGEEGPRDLYGRSSALLGPGGVLARSIEILAPIPDALPLRRAAND